MSLPRISDCLRRILTAVGYALSHAEPRIGYPQARLTYWEGEKDA